MSTALRVVLGKFGRVALLEMDRPLVNHVHSQCHVLFKIEGFDTQFNVAGKTVPLTDDSAVLINAWKQHAYAHQPGQPRTVILALYVESRWLSLFRENWRASGAPGFFPHSTGQITAQMSRQARAVAEAMVYEPENAAEHERLISALMVSTIERMAYWRDEAPSLREMAHYTSLSDPRIDRAIRTIKTNPGAVRSMEWLAKESGLSRAQLFRLFESHVGMAPRVYLNMIRIDRAVDAVANGRQALSVISDELGFSVPAHFSRFFHDHAGSSPGTFRKVSCASQAKD